MAENMKLCPFCGSPGVILKSWTGAFCTPSCDGQAKCPGQHMEQDEQGGFTAEYCSEEEAISAWNIRYNSSGI